MEDTKGVSTRYKFSDLFEERADGSLSPKVQIKINGIIFGPGVVFQKGVAFGGVDFHLYKNRDIAATDLIDGSKEIEGFYK